MKWTKDTFYSNTKWYHATSTDFAFSIISKGVLAEINKTKPLDFGYGFYLTPNKEWACKYLTEQLHVTENDASVDVNDGYILEFEFVPKNYEQSHKTKFFDGLNNQFAKFVFRNRMYYKYHIFSKCVHKYDFVAGPMSDGKQLNDFLEYQLHKISKKQLFERLLKPNEDWQLLLHSQELCDKLKLVKVYNTKGDEVDVTSIQKKSN